MSIESPASSGNEAQISILENQIKSLKDLIEKTRTAVPTSPLRVTPESRATMIAMREQELAGLEERLTQLKK